MLPNIWCIIDKVNKIWWCSVNIETQDVKYVHGSNMNKFLILVIDIEDVHGYYMDIS